MADAQTPTRSRLAGSAYWATMRRIVVVAGCIDAAWIPFYAAIDAPFLAALNVASAALYGVAYWLIGQRRNRLAMGLVWLEVLVHSAAGSLLIGWNSGFHYFLLMFIPAIVVGSRPRIAVPLVVALLGFYLGLRFVCDTLGPLSPLEPGALRAAGWLNVTLVFGMFYAMAAYYRATVIRAEQRLLVAATTDALTGLANRGHFLQRAATELAHARRRRSATTLVLADVDFFKRVNDEHGHDAGDRALLQVAGALRDTLRETDVLARWGGEEFLVLLPDCNLASAQGLAERLRAAVAAAPVPLEGRTLHVTASFGVTEIKDPQDLQAALERADEALYLSKHQGRNRVTLAPAVQPTPPVQPADAPAEVSHGFGSVGPLPATR